MAAPLVITPIFPLPDVTFFPHTLMPLHVFEPRYRVMIRHVMEGDHEFGVVPQRFHFVADAAADIHDPRDEYEEPRRRERRKSAGADHEPPPVKPAPAKQDDAARAPADESAEPPTQP